MQVVTVAPAEAEELTTVNVAEASPPRIPAAINARVATMRLLDRGGCKALDLHDLVRTLALAESQRNADAHRRTAVPASQLAAMIRPDRLVRSVRLQWKVMDLAVKV